MDGFHSRDLQRQASGAIRTVAGGAAQSDHRFNAMKNVLGIILFAQFAVAIDASAQSLAEAARRERARQQTVQSRIVITNGRTVSTAATTGATVAASSTSSATAAAVPVVKPPTDSK